MGFTTRRWLQGAGVVAVVVLLAGCRPHVSTQARSSQTVPHSTTRSLMRKPSPPESGNTVVAEALAVVAQQTAMPLRGPEGLRGHLLSAPTWLTAAVTAAPSRYAVELVWVPKPGPPPESRKVFMSQVADPRALSPDGSFGGRHYPSTAAARAALPRSNVAFTSPPRRHATIRPVDGVTMRVWHLASDESLIMWRQEGWTVELRGRVTLVQARQLARAITGHPLPAGPGLFAEAVTRRGTTTVLDWRQAQDIYWTRAAQPTLALIMAHAFVSYRQVSATLFGDRRPLAPDRVIAEQEQLNRASPWVDLTAPRQNQAIRPGGLLVIAGHVLTQSPYITFAPNGPHIIGVSLAAGYENPSLGIASGVIRVSASGTFSGTLRIPYELPALDGPRVTVSLQFSSRMAPVTLVVLNPRGAGGR